MSSIKLNRTLEGPLERGHLSIRATGQNVIVAGIPLTSFLDGYSGFQLRDKNIVAQIVALRYSPNFQFEGVCNR